MAAKRVRIYADPEEYGTYPPQCRARGRSDACPQLCTQMTGQLWRSLWRKKSWEKTIRFIYDRHFESGHIWFRIRKKFNYKKQIFLYKNFGRKKFPVLQLD